MATMIRSSTARRMAPPRADTKALDGLGMYHGISGEGPGGGAALDMLDLFLADAGHQPLLSADEERALLAAVRGSGHPRERESGDAKAAKAARAARERLCAANLRLVVSIAKRYQHVPGIDLLDLIQEGAIGLLHAIETFDPARASRLSTHASWWIWQAISRALGDQTRIIRLPIHVRGTHNAVRRTRRALFETLLREPTAEEIAAALAAAATAGAETGAGATGSRVLDADEVRALEAAWAPTVSLDVPVRSSGHPRERESDGGTFADLLGDPDVLGGDPAESPAVNAAAARATVAWLLDPTMDEWDGATAELADGETRVYQPLTARERHALALRFGLETHGPMLTLRQVGAVLGLSPERVRQVLDGALAKLRVLAALLGLGAREVL